MKEILSYRFTLLIILMCVNLFIGHNFVYGNEIGLIKGEVTSSSVTLGWEPQAGTTEVRIYLASEPAVIQDGSLPGQILIKNIFGNVSSCLIGNLAAEVDVFFHVEVDSASGTLQSNIHARTIGGQNSGTDTRATEIDTPLRSIHVEAPNIIHLVLAEFEIDATTSLSASNNDGQEWQNGTWQISRADSTAINVTAIHRQTVPVGAWKFSHGYGVPYSTRAIDADHHIWLKLDENIGNREILTISGPKGLHFILPFSDKYLVTTALQVNQVGYNPRATERWAYVSQWMGDGGGLDLTAFPTYANVVLDPADALIEKPIVLANLPITLRSSFDSDAGAAVKQIDLSELPASEGARYRIQIPGVGVSWPTAVSEEAAYKAFFTVTRGLYFQRWGDTLDSQYTEWSRGMSHVSRPGLSELGEDPEQTYPSLYEADLEWVGGTQFFPQSTPKVNPITLHGGHHDASDYDMGTVHTIVAQLLMRSFELNTGNLVDSQLILPESGNGIPDILDEALWEIKQWEGLQESNGGVRAGVESYRHPLGIYHNQEDALPYWTYAVHPETTARSAGIFAQAARLLVPYNQTRSDELKARAISAYSYAKNNGATQNYLLYGASELYALTGLSTYKSDFETIWDTLDTWGNGAYDGMQMSQQNSSHMPDFTLGYLNSSGAIASYVSVAEARLQNVVNDVLSVLQNDHAHRNPRPDGGATAWGASSAMGRYLDTLYAQMSLGNMSALQKQEYFNAMSLSADYILGCNPMGMSWIVGLGSRYPHQMDHNDSLSFVKDGKGPIPGIPVYGVIGQLPLTPAGVYPAQVFYPGNASLPTYRRYGDTWTMIAMSEFTIGECSAPHIQLFATLLGANQVPPTSYLPYGSEHRNTLTKSENSSPVVNAGSDQHVLRGTGNVVVDLQGTYNDDGRTSGPVTVQWKLGHGPAAVTFSSSTNLVSQVTFTRGGEYQLHLVIDDGEMEGLDTLTIVVADTQATSPVVDAGPDFQIQLPINSINLDGTISGSGSMSVRWNVASAPAGGVVEFVDPGTVDTVATFNIPGRYILRLSADNGTLYSADFLEVQVGVYGQFGWPSANVSDANTIALYHFDETTGVLADNAQGTSDRDMVMGDASVWSKQNAWGGTGGHINVKEFGGSLSSATLPVDWSNGLTLSFWMRANYQVGPDIRPIKLQGTSDWANETYLKWNYGNLNTDVATHDKQVSLKALALVDPERTLSFEEVTDGKWHHYAIVYTGDSTAKGRLYVDNKLQEINTSGDTEWDASGGSIQTLGQIIISSFDGEIDELLIQKGVVTDFSHGYDSSKNWAPWVDAGDNISINDIQQTANLDGYVTDDGYSGTLAVTWTKQSGPGNVIFGNTSLSETTANFTASGIYTLRLSASDGSLSSFDEVIVRVLSNVAPVVYAGNDQIVLLNSMAVMDASATDDGLPNPPSSLAYAWSKFSGPGSVTFSDPNVEDPTITYISEAGTYVLALNVSDGSLQGSDYVTITAHNAPVVDAGDDQTVTLPANAMLNATVTDDGLPLPTTLTTIWNKISGPGLVTFSDPTNISTTVSFASSGTYVLQLTVADGASVASDTVILTVNAPGQQIYFADFDTDVSGDWSMQNTSISTNESCMIVNAGWGTIGTAYLSGAMQISETDVRLTGHFTVRNGNSNGYAEVACRTTSTGSDGIRLQLTGNGNLYLYDGSTLCDEVTNTGISAFYNPSISYILIAEGNTISAKVTQNAGNDGQGHSWADVSIDLTGTASTYTNSGNVRFSGRSYTGQPRLLDLQVESLSPVANQAPSAVDDSYGINEDTTLNINVPGVLGNDTDPENNALTAVLVTDVSHGTLNLNADGSFSYLPAGNYFGSDSFTYIANDGSNDSGPATVSLTINPVNDAPTVTAGIDSVLTLPVNQYALDATVNDVDSMPSLTWSMVSGPASVVFTNANLEDTTVTFTVAGTYVLRLTADDSTTQVYDELSVTVQAAALAVINGDYVGNWYEGLISTGSTITYNQTRDNLDCVALTLEDGASAGLRINHSVPKSTADNYTKLGCYIWVDSLSGRGLDGLKLWATGGSDAFVYAQWYPTVTNEWQYFEVNLPSDWDSSTQIDYIDFREYGNTSNATFLIRDLKFIE